MEEEIRHLLEENLKLTREVHRMVAKMRKYLMWQRAISMLYFIMLIAPLILAIIYLPPILRPLWEEAQPLLGALPNSQHSNGFLQMLGLPFDFQTSSDQQLLKLLDAGRSLPKNIQ